MSGAHNANGDVVHTKDILHVGGSGHYPQLRNKLWYRHTTSGRIVPHGTNIAIITRIDGLTTIVVVYLNN